MKRTTWMVVVSLIALAVLLMSGCQQPVPTPTPTAPPRPTATPTRMPTATPTPTPMPTATPTPTAIFAPALTSTPTPTDTPMPPQSPPPVMVWDKHHSGSGIGLDLWTISKLAREKGWQVVELDIEPLTISALRRHNTRVLLISTVSVAYTDSELAALREFVAGGGALLIETPQGLYGRQDVRELTRMFSIDVTEDFTREVTVSVSSGHALLRDVTALYFRGYEDVNQRFGILYLSVEPPARFLIQGGPTEPYKPLIAFYEEPGGGKVLVYPQYMDLDRNRADNGVFLANILRWLGPS